MSRDVLVDGAGRVRLVAPKLPEASTLNDRDEILAEADALLVDIGLVRTQLESARAADDYADRDWYRRASTALRLKGARHQALLRRAAQLRKKGADTWSKHFVEAARRRLKPEVFHDLVAEAHEMNEPTP